MVLSLHVDTQTWNMGHDGACTLHAESHSEQRRSSGRHPGVCCRWHLEAVVERLCVTHKQLRTPLNETHALT